MRRGGRRGEQPRRASGRNRWRANPFSMGAAVVAWVGLAVLLYPSASSWFTEVQQARIITTYTTDVDMGLDPPAAEQLRNAHDYNNALNSGAILEANHRLPTGAGSTTNSSLDYDGLLRADVSGVMARIQIPVIDLDLPVYHGTTDETLLMGIGHLQGTSLPVGGKGTHAVLTGHRGLATATMFTDLNQVLAGDRFSISVFDEVLTYTVTSSIVVDPDETEALRPVEGKDLVTLVTCTPLGINSQRILLTGERVYPTPVEDVVAAQARPEPGLPWWAVAFAVGTLLIGLYAWRSGYPPRRRGGGARVEPVGSVPAPVTATATG